MSREITIDGHQPIVSKEDLLSIFFRGCKKPADYRVGLETEKIGVHGTSGALSFECKDGIEAILISYAERYGWSKILDQGRVIALEKGKQGITLEPGGQLELSGSPLRFVHEIEDELLTHLRDLKEIAGPLDVRFLNVGINPHRTLWEVPWMPKSRYKIMRAYYENKGMAHQMMKLTASSQINMDFESEADAVKKIKVGSALGPVIGAMFANSAIESDAYNGFCSRRLQIWQNMDADRCGIQPFFIDGTFSFEKYTDYALNVPMYFIVRSGEYIDKTHLTFAKYLEQERERATVTDWLLHLTTLFPDVRVKGHVEFRTADATDPELTLALVALWIGLVYNQEALDALDDMVSGYTQEDVVLATKEASERGLAGKMKGRPMLDIARQAMQIAIMGLSKIDQAFSTNQMKYLSPLRDLLEKGKSPAEQLLGR